MSRIFITGGAGMIGANLAHRLVGDGHELFILARPGSSLYRLQPIENKIHILIGDITDKESVRDCLRETKPEIVYHLAATRLNPPTADSETHFQVNVLGTLHVLEALRELEGSRLVFTGSSTEYGTEERLSETNPLMPGTVLGASKAAATLLVQTHARLYGTNAVVLRLFTPYGPWDPPHRLIPHTILSALQGKDVTTTAGKQERDFVYIDDVVDALIKAAAAPLQTGSIFNIGSGTSASVREMAGLILKLMGQPVKILAGALSTRSDEIDRMSADITLAREALGWEPQIGIEEGLRRTIAWFTEHHKLVPQ